jgi:hypothetical protein
MQLTNTQALGLGVGVSEFTAHHVRVAAKALARTVADALRWAATRVGLPGV